MSQPSANIAGVVIRIPASGSIPSWSQSVKARKAPRIRRAPWAMLITFITPKISVSPDANSAYTPPISNPKAVSWMNSVTCR